MDFQLTGKVAIICAASKGLGKACAEALGREGVKVVICSRNPDNLKEAAEDIRAKTGTEVLPIACNLNDSADRKNLVSKSIATFGSIDILITNVGHPSHGGLLELENKDWKLGFENILFPSVELCQLVIPHMQKNKWGRIVNISSYVIKEPSAKYMISSVFRTALAAFSKCLSQEFGGDGILVNTVCPSLFRTPLGERLLSKWAEQSGKTVAAIETEKGSITRVGRIGEPEDLADVVTFLCSKNAGYVTGQAIMLDGGKSVSLF